MRYGVTLVFVQLYFRVHAGECQVRAVVFPRAYLDVSSQSSSFYTNLTSAASPLAGRCCGIRNYEGRQARSKSTAGGFFTRRFWVSQHFMSPVTVIKVWSFHPILDKYELGR
jgi:hypothetical protein